MNHTSAALAVEQLIRYSLDKGLIEAIDTMFVRNQLLDLLKLPEPYSGHMDGDTPPLEPVLNQLLDYAQAEGLIGDGTTERDLFDTRIMGLLTPRPSEVAGRFSRLFKHSAKSATDWFYDLCQNNDYIRTQRIRKNQKWEYSDPDYGTLEITINLSKPEKDPREIAKLKTMPKSGYPACMLCAENMGYPGRLDHPARQNLRLIPLTLNNESWYMQYSPYVYYNEHCIVLKNEHTPMFMNRDTFKRLLEFVDMFPHYFLGSNAGLPIVGGSILNHDHFQGGGYEMPMAKAPLKYEFVMNRFPSVKAGAIRWPMAGIRLKSRDMDELTDAVAYLFDCWENYDDPAVNIESFSDGSKHNAITPIARKRGDVYELDMVLRNNLTSAEHPMGIYHPHEQYHNIKRENIGLIEVMGLFILPGRLQEELSQISGILTGKIIFKAASLRKDHPLYKHAAWIEQLIAKHGNALGKEQADSIIRSEVGLVCRRVLECASVFKDDDAGNKALLRFTNCL